MTGINTKLKATEFFDECFNETISMENFDCDSSEELKGKVREKIKNLVTIGDFLTENWSFKKCLKRIELNAKSLQVMANIR